MMGLMVMFVVRVVMIELMMFVVMVGMVLLVVMVIMVGLVMDFDGHDISLSLQMFPSHGNLWTFLSLFVL